MDRQAKRDYDRQYYRAHRGKIIKRSLEWAKKHPERRREMERKSRKTHPETAKAWRRMKKLEVLTHYSGTPPKCACCGDRHIEFLTIDHINGGGNKHFKSLGIRGGLAFYLWLIKNNFPTGYRVLCMNCNFALGRFGYCPHQLGKRGD